MNSVNTSFNINNSNIIKKLFALNQDNHCKDMLILKTSIFKISIMTNITFFNAFVLLTLTPSEISILSYSSNYTLLATSVS